MLRGIGARLDMDIERPLTLVGPQRRQGLKAKP